MKNKLATKNCKKIDKKDLIFVCLIFTALLLFSDKTADQKIADLESKLAHATGIEKVHLLNDLGDEYQNINPQKCIDYAKEALALSQKLNYKKGAAKALNDIGNAFYNQSKYDQTLEYYHKFLKIREEIGEKSGIADALTNIGKYYYATGKYDQALEYFKKSMKIEESINDKSSIASSLGNIGLIYFQWGKYEQALEYYHQSLKIKEDVGDKSSVANTLNSIGSIYGERGKYDLALIYFQKSLKINEEIGDKFNIARSFGNIGSVYKCIGKYNQALEYLLNSLKIKEKIGDKSGISDSLINIGYIYYDKGKYNQALKYLHDSLKTKEEIGDKKGAAKSLNIIGNCYLKLHKFVESEKYLNQSLNIVKELKILTLISDNYLSLSELFETQGNIKKAFEYYKLFHGANEKIFNEKSNKQINELQAKYEAEKREKEIKLLKQNDEIQSLKLARARIFRTAFLTGFFLLLIILVFLFKKYLYLFAFWKKVNYIGKYRLINEIGSGGMGIVYKASDIKDSRNVVAIKVLKDIRFSDDSDRQRFNHEFEIIKKIEHPHIIRIFERGESKNQSYIVMEWINGKNLFQVIKDKGKLPIRDGLHIMTQLTNTLVFMHGQGIIHGDLKPENIMLLEKNGDPYFVKLLDFGMSKSKQLSRLTLPGELAGTFYYFSPEQLEGGKVTQASDIYALGVVFYQMVTGAMPFPGDSLAEIKPLVLKQNPIEPIQLFPEIPDWVNQLILRMMYKDPLKRTSSFEVMEILADIGNSEMACQETAEEYSLGKVEK